MRDLIRKILLEETHWEITDVIIEYYMDIFDKYGLGLSGVGHNFSDAWRRE